MNPRGSVIQGYFRPRGPRPAISPLQNPIQPRMANVGVRRPPSYQELTLQAHQRSAGLSLQPTIANGTAFALPPHLVSFDRRPGQQLPAAIQQKMGSFFKADFSDVQVHIGPEALSIGALAFTQGSNIFFAPGQYNPESHFGQQLLAHELTHVVQQRAGRVRNPFGSGVAVVQDPTLEAEAERMGHQAASHHPLAWINPVLQQKPATPGNEERKAILARIARHSPPSVMRAWSPVLQRMQSEEGGEEAAEPRYPQRKRKDSPSAGGGAAQFILNGFDNFNATESSEGDGKNATAIKLKIGKRVYPGATGLNHGHAEMDALYDFCKEHGDDAIAEFKKAKVKTISCTKKPCCVKCSAIMGHLGFRPAAGTNKTYHTMGGTEWGVDPIVKKFIAAYASVSEDTITGMGNVAQKDLIPRKKQKQEGKQQEDDDVDEVSD